MKSNCELCGHELGFFERSLKIENTRLGLSYQTLCSACHRSVSIAVDKIEAICTSMINELRGKLSKYRYASGDLNVLIFLAVKEIFRHEPDFDDPDGLLEQTFYPEEERSVKTRFDYLIQITYKVLRNGFISVLGRYGLDTYEAFAGFMGRECLFQEQILCNCGPEAQFVYTDLFACSAGLVFHATDEQIVRSLFVSRDRTVKYEESHQGATYDLTILRQKFHKLKVKPEIRYNREDQRTDLVKRLNSYNEHKSARIESELKALISNLNVHIEKDLRAMHPDEELGDIPLDSVLVSIIKTLFEQDIGQDYVHEAPDGLLLLIIERCYTRNFEMSGLSDIEEVQDYITDECKFVWDFNAAFGNEPQVPAFAFLTPRAYMIKPLNSPGAFMASRGRIPNDLYCDFQYMIFQGDQEFYIATSSSKRNEDGYYFLTGVRINAEDQEVLDSLEEYFSEKAFDYYEYELEKENEKIDSLREKEIRDQARRIFVGFGYLPFCIYDEWAAVERNIRQSDLLMRSLIKEREPKTGTHNAKIFYAGKTVSSFEQQAAKLAEDLDIKKLPVARALLWSALKKEVLEVCSQEFKRLCGDIVDENDALEDAFIKYSSLSEIQSEKAYYLGLFIYYLMDKGILEPTDFLDHYDEAAKLYIKLNPGNKKIIEFSELITPQARSFDTQSIDFANFNVEVEDEIKEIPIDNSFLYSIRQEEGDIDSIDNLIEKLSEELEPEEIKELTGELPNLELLSDLILSLEDTGEKEEPVHGNIEMDNSVHSGTLFNGIEFIDVDSEAAEIEAPSDIIETDLSQNIEVEPLDKEYKPQRRRGFDSVRTIVGFGRRKKQT